MEQGKTFALISDAGSPLVSDPGGLLVQEMIARGIPFTSVPGPSAVITALVLSGLPTEPFSFLGFLPSSETQRRAVLERIARLTGYTIVLFESPQRVLGLLREIGEILGNRKISVCRELTKMHEEVLRGTVGQLLPQLSSRKLQGEFSVVIAPGEAAPIEMTEEDVRARFSQLVNEGLNKKEALKRLAKESGRSRNELYDLLMR